MMNFRPFVKEDSEKYPEVSLVHVKDIPRIAESEDTTVIVSYSKTYHKVVIRVINSSNNLDKEITMYMICNTEYVGNLIANSIINDLNNGWSSFKIYDKYGLSFTEEY